MQIGIRTVAVAIDIATIEVEEEKFLRVSTNNLFWNKAITR
jgi:hypothetical protein